MRDIKLENSIGYADILTIVFKDKSVEIILDDERDFTFKDVLDTAYKNGYCDGTIFLIAESPLNGRIYQYGNYGDFWVEHGTTRGYA